ncbi:MAG: penicillin acylase family protein [Dehalococcoidia bacterium]
MTTTHVRPEDCLATIEGELTVSGADGPIRIVRDRWGIPHIQATTARDAFFGQGYCIGQDRLWQLELERQMARGGRAAMMGPKLVGRDRLARRMGYARYAEAEWEAQTENAKMVLQAYADGINAARETNPKPYEFHVLSHEMEPWHPVDTLAVIKLISANNHWASKLKFGKVGEALGAEAVASLVADLPEGTSLITPSRAKWTLETHPFAEDIEAAMGAPDGVVAAGGGSNCWVIHGSRTDTGAPIVCGDPHLEVMVPGQWYVLHMECPEFTAAGPVNPCYPGPLYYGHNTKVAWTMTHAAGDRWDLYRERIRQGEHGPEAQHGDRWEPLRRIEERIAVLDGPDEVEVVWESRHGPVIAGDPTRDDEVVAAAWGLHEPAHDVEAVWRLLTSTNAAEAREAVRTFDSISGNFCFADQSGDIGYQYSGRIPKRRRPALVPVPGWTDDYEWDGSIPKDELPAQQNPEAGYIVTANNKTVDGDYPYYLSFTANRFRADRLNALFEDTEIFRLDAMPELQGDIVSTHAQDLVPHLVAFEATDPEARAMQDLLRGWGASMDVDSAAAAVYWRTAEHLAASTVRAYYGQVAGIPSTSAADEARTLLQELEAGRTTMLPAGQSWPHAIEAALVAAAETLRERQGPDASKWRWGAEHHMGYHHNLGRDPELAKVLNIPDVEVPGDGNTPFATQMAWGPTADHGVTYRQVLDLRDLNAARIVIPPGNSGQPGSPHYADNIERWRNVEYHPLFIEWTDIEANAEGELRLTPA